MISLNVILAEKGDSIQNCTIYIRNDKIFDFIRKYLDIEVVCLYVDVSTLSKLRRPIFGIPQGEIYWWSGLCLPNEVYINWSEMFVCVYVDFLEKGDFISAVLQGIISGLVYCVNVNRESNISNVYNCLCANTLSLDIDTTNSIIIWSNHIPPWKTAVMS